jgi:hypothetical protein
MNRVCHLTKNVNVSCFKDAKNIHYTKMCSSLFWVSLILNEFGHFYHGETSQPPSEQGLVVTNSELVH